MDGQEQREFYFGRKRVGGVSTYVTHGNSRKRRIGQEMNAMKGNKKRIGKKGERKGRMKK